MERCEVERPNKEGAPPAETAAAAELGLVSLIEMLGGGVSVSGVAAVTRLTRGPKPRDRKHGSRKILKGRRRGQEKSHLRGTQRARPSRRPGSGNERK